MTRTIVARIPHASDADHGVDVSLIAHLAFARGGQGAPAPADGRHLALLPTESLELDLSDPAQRQIGDYELLELIGEGGMGVVYRARQVSLDREVAIKLLAAGVWASAEFIERFRREAQNAARMQHPNIVPVYEVGSHDELQFFSMSLVRGPSLAAKLRSTGTLAPQRAAQLLRTVAEAVDYAHRLGVLHLDLKPANVLVDENGNPHVADFGLARRLDSALAADSDEVSGTPSYMAPEQASPRTRRITRATDIWGLGAILYELVTGEPPFLARSPQETLKLVVEGSLRNPRRLAPMLPRDLEAVILKCMAYRVEERYASARDLADDLSRFLEGRAVGARPLNVGQRALRWARREPKLAAMTGCAFAALLIGLAATTQQWRRANHNALHAEANAATAREHLWDSRDASALRLMESGDGWNAAPLLLANITEMEANGAEDRVVAARRKLGIIERANPQLIDAIDLDGRITALTFDDDGTKLAVSTSAAPVAIYEVASGALTPLRFSTSGPVWEMMGLDRLAFTPDGTKIFGGSPPGARMIPRWTATDQFGDLANGLWRAVGEASSLENGGPEGVIAPDGRFAIVTDAAARSQVAATDPWRSLTPSRKLAVNPGLPFVLTLFAPDDRWFAATHHGALEFVDMQTLRETRVALPAEFEIVYAWEISPDSRWLVISDHQGHALAIDHATGTLRPLEPLPPYPISWFAFNKDGTQLAAASGKGGVYLWRWPTGGLLVPPFGGAASADHVAFDDGHDRLLVNGNDATAAIWQVVPARFDVDRREAVQLGDRIAVAPSIMPVAWHAATGLLADSRGALRLSRLPPPVLKQARAAPIKPSTLRFDGRHLVAVEGSRVRVVDALRETPVAGPFELPQAPSFAQLSADGATLVAVSGRELHAFDVAGGKARFAPVVLANSPLHVELSPDGRHVLTTWLDHGKEQSGEQIELWDLADGHRVAGPVRVPGPLEELLFSTSGRRLLVWNREYASLRDAGTLAPVSGPLADLRAPGFRQRREKGEFLSAALDGDDPLIVEAYGNDDAASPELIRAEFHRYDGDGHVQREKATLNWKTLLARPGAREIMVVTGDDPVSLHAADGQVRELDDSPDPGANRGHALAASVDGRWLARSLNDGVELFDARDGKRLARLHAPLPLPDRVWQLAFSPDGNRLLAATMRNRWLVFDIGPDTRTAGAIAREIGLRAIEYREDAARTTEAVSAAERAALHAADPGAPAAMVKIDESSVARQLPSGAIPVRDPQTPPECLDLTPVYNRAFGDAMTPTMSAPSDYAWLLRGVQRLLGVDYDIRGAIQLRDADGFVEQAQFDTPKIISLTLHDRTAAALDVLLLANYPQDEIPLATVTLHYAAGGEAQLPILYGRDVFHWRRLAQLSDTARLATLGYDARMLPEFWRHVRVYAVRLENPHPERVIDYLTVTAAKGVGGAPVILAMTLQSSPSAEGRHEPE
jgi:WD40 repeat protein